MQAFVPKNRKPKFELLLKIIDLNNIPLVCGTAYVKWHLPSSTSAEHRGRTDKSLIKDHKAAWDYEKWLQVRLTVDRSGMLQETEIHFEITQEYSAGSRGDRIHLGNIKLNLAEYVERSDEDEDEGITRRYLMQESKINGTLKIEILMKQIEGDRNFICPPLKTAPVFGGIAGIVAGEPGDPDDNGHMPSITNKTRELGELQDMYRRTLAASWACRAGELPPQDLIENLFAGGTGWRSDVVTKTPAQFRAEQVAKQRAEGEDSGSISDSSSKLTVQRARRHPSAAMRPQTPMGRGGHSRNTSTASVTSIGGGNDSSSPTSGMSGRRSISQQVKESEEQKRRRRSVRPPEEITEFNVRDDLKTWQISARG